MRRRFDPCGVGAIAAPIVLALALGLACCPGTARAAPEIDHDAFWIESTFCAVTLRLRADAVPADAVKALAGLVGAPAHCTGAMASQAQPGGVLALLQRGFRITAAQHQVVPLPQATRGEPEPTLLVTALFVLERPATKLAPIPK